MELKNGDLKVEKISIIYTLCEGHIYQMVSYTTEVLLQNSNTI